MRLVVTGTPPPTKWDLETPNLAPGHPRPQTHSNFSTPYLENWANTLSKRPQKNRKSGEGIRVSQGSKSPRTPNVPGHATSQPAPSPYPATRASSSAGSADAREMDCGEERMSVSSIALENLRKSAKHGAVTVNHPTGPPPNRPTRDTRPRSSQSSETHQPQS